MVLCTILNWVVGSVNMNWLMTVMDTLICYHLRVVLSLILDDVPTVWYWSKLKSMFDAWDEVVRDNSCSLVWLMCVFFSGHGCLAWLVMLPVYSINFYYVHIYTHTHTNTCMYLCILVCTIVYYLLVHSLNFGLVYLYVTSVCRCVLVHLRLVHMCVPCFTIMHVCALPLEPDLYSTLCWPCMHLHLPGLVLLCALLFTLPNLYACLTLSLPMFEFLLVWVHLLSRLYVAVLLLLCFSLEHLCWAIELDLCCT